MPPDAPDARRELARLSARVHVHGARAEAFVLVLVRDAAPHSRHLAIERRVRRARAFVRELPRGPARGVRAVRAADADGGAQGRAPVHRAEGAVRQARLFSLVLDPPIRVGVERELEQEAVVVDVLLGNQAVLREDGLVRLGRRSSEGMRGSRGCRGSAGGRGRRGLQVGKFIHPLGATFPTGLLARRSGAAFPVLAIVWFVRGRERRRGETRTFRRRNRVTSPAWPSSATAISSAWLRMSSTTCARAGGGVSGAVGRAIPRNFASARGETTNKLRAPTASGKRAPRGGEAPGARARAGAFATRTHHRVDASRVVRPGRGRRRVPVRLVRREPAPGPLRFRRRHHHIDAALHGARRLKVERATPTLPERVARRTKRACDGNRRRSRASRCVHDRAPPSCGRRFLECRQSTRRTREATS